MEADLVRAGEATATRLGPGQPSRLSLAGGRYRLEVRSIRKNNRAPYTLSAFPEALLAGMEREVRAPAEVPLAVGEAGLVEIASFGSVDVKARLFDARGSLLAASDDRADDWNFQIAATLPPGPYLLRVDPVGAAAGTTSVRLRVPSQEEKPALTLPASFEVNPGRGSLVYPLQGFRGDLLLVQVRSADSVGLALEARHGDTWVVEGSATGRGVRLEVPLATSDPLRLRLWSEDRRDAMARLAVVGLDSASRERERLAPRLPAHGRGRAAFAHRRRRARAGPAGPLARGRGGRPALLHYGGRRLPSRHGRPRGRAGASALRRDGDARRAAPRRTRPARSQQQPRRRGAAAGAGTRRSGPVDRPAAGAGALPFAPARALDRRAARGTAALGHGDGRGARIRGRPSPCRRRSRSRWRSPRARRSRDSGPSGEATLEAVALPKATSGRIAPGVTDGRLEGRAAVAYELPAGAKRLRLALARGTAAVLSRDADVESVFAPDEDSVETVYTQAPTLTLLHTEPGEGRFSVEVMSAEAPALAAGQPLELPQGEAGVLRLALNGPAGATLRVRGAASEVTLVEESGAVRRGSDIALTGPGTLIVRHGRGPLVAWLETEGQDARALWGGALAPVREAALPSFVKLDRASCRP